MDENVTLKKLKCKDEKALEWFIDRYAGYVNTIIYNIIGSSADSSDIEAVSADVFFTLWENAGRILPGKIKAFLGGVSRNKAKEYLRRTRADVSLEDDIIIISDENLERDFEKREMANFLRKAILAMPCPEREIFIRYYYYYEPVLEIAEEMDLNSSTVKTKLHRGRNALKEILERGGYTVEN